MLTRSTIAGPWASSCWTIVVIWVSCCVDVVVVVWVEGEVVAMLPDAVVPNVVAACSVDVVDDGCVADDEVELEPATLPERVVLVEGDVVAVDELVVGEVALVSLLISVVLPERVVLVALDVVEPLWVRVLPGSADAVDGFSLVESDCRVEELEVEGDVAPEERSVPEERVDDFVPDCD